MIDFSNITAVALGVEEVIQIEDSLGTVLWQKAQPVIADYFYVEDASGSNNTLSITRETSNAPAIEVFASTDGSVWNSLGTTTVGTPLTATIPANGKLYLKATANRWCYNTSSSNTVANKISCSGNFNVGGNIMSLLNGDNFENTLLTSNNTSTFRGLFANVTNLVSVVNLVLPNNTVNYCYEKMFYGCTSLTESPVFPATTVGGWCYVEMFQGCTALTTVPALSMTSAGSIACTNMFNGCSSLTETPVLYVTNITSGRVFENMFANCTRLNKVYTYADSITNSSVRNWLANVAATGDFYALGSANWTIDSPSGVPVGWTLHHSLPVPCNVSISAGSNGSVSVNGVSGDYSQSVAAGTVLTLVATADSGYYFTGWSDGNTSASRTITVTADLTLTASFAQVVNFNVSVSAGSNGSVSVNGVSGDYSQSVAAGTVLTLVATPDSGYMLDEWSDNVSTNPRTVTVNSNLTLTASFIVQQQLNNEIWYETSNNQTADFSNAGFNGTQTSNTYSNNKGVATYSANITSASGNSSTSRATNLTKISFPDTLTSIGQHTFDGCPLTELDFNNVTSVGCEAFDNNHIQHLHIPATLTSINYNPFRSSYITQITVDSNNPNYNDGSAHNGSNCIYSGTTLMCGCVNTVIPDNCTIIGDWSMSNNYSLTTVSLPATVTQIKQYAFAGDTTVPVTTMYVRNNPSFGTQPFMGWQTGGTLYYTSNVNYQNWLNRLPSGWTAVLLCDVTVSAGNNGSVSVNGVSGNYHQPELVSGTQLTLVATPDSGYYLTSWSDGDTNTSRTITVTGDLTLTASFAQVVNYNVSVSAGNNGSVSVNGVTGNYSQSVAAGTTLTLAATADSGYMFDEWSDNVSTNPRTITVTGNITLTASFVVQQQLNDELWYRTSNNQPISLTNMSFGGVSVVSNTYTNGKGVVKFSGDLTSMSNSTTNSPSQYLTHIWFPDSLTNVGQHSFIGCPIENLDLNNITTVGVGAFLGHHTEHIHIPATCTSIGYRSLRSPYTTSITVDANNTVYNDGSTHNGSNCIYTGTTLQTGCKNTVIPDNCTTIGGWALSECGMVSMNIPASVQTVGESSMDNNTNLTTLYVHSTPTFGYAPFYNTKTNGTLYYTSNVNYQNWLNRLPNGWTAVLLCDVTVSAGNNGSVSVNGTSGNYHQSELVSGTQLTLVATPAAGYQFDSWSDGDTNASRTVTITADTTLTASFVQAQPVGEYFYVEDASGSSNTLTIEKHTTDAPTIEVFKSTDGTNWTSMGNTSTSGITATVPANGKLYLKAVTDKWRDAGGTYHYHNIGCNADFKIGGHITSLLFGDNYAIYPLNSTTNANAFENLFEGNDYLIDASDLVLPDSTAPYCYFAMFEYDHNLAGAPVLPATTLAMSCYGRLFRDCTSINEIVCYADTIGSDSTFKWLAGVSSTGDFYNLGSAVYSSDENGIPSGWTVHTSL